MICLVDDDPSVLKSLGRLLASEGHPSLPFCDPAAFVTHASNHAVALAVVDLMMPGLSGLQVQENLRRHSPATRVIMISATDESEPRLKALAAGACAFLSKPFNEREFLDVVRGALLPAESRLATPQRIPSPLAVPGPQF